MEPTLLQSLDLTPLWVMRLLFGLIVAILFIQSGLDKIFNYQGEQSFYKSHFKDSILHGMVPLLMPVITLFEVAAGFLTGIGLVLYLVNGSTNLAVIGLFLACLAIIQLFFGQRVAKDYAGAGALVPYFLLCAAGLYIFMV